MMPKSNFHTHTTFCDGKNTPEEMVLKAIDEGFSALGFSGHSYTPFDESYCMSQSDTKAYVEEINRLKSAYKDKINIYCGIEQDYFSTIDTSCFDYVIGSVHYAEKDGVYYAVDCGEKEFAHAVEKGWGGDVYAFIEDYFSLVGDIFQKTRCHIVGHFDLVSKFNEHEEFFSFSHPRYISASENAAKKIISSKAVVEINTGAISRGYRTKPYPEERILSLMAQGGVEFVFSSDCHNKDFLSFGFDMAQETVKNLCGKELCGFKK